MKTLKLAILASAALLFITGCDDSGGDSGASGSHQDPTGHYTLVNDLTVGPGDVFKNNATGGAYVDKDFNISYTLKYKNNGRTLHQAFNIKSLDPDFLYDGDTIAYTIGSSEVYFSHTWQRLP